MMLTAIIPTKNRGRLLAETVAGVLAQTRPPDELLIVDQSCDEAARDAVAAVWSQAPQEVRERVALRYFLEPGVNGVPAARNFAMARAGGDIWWFLDDDLELEPDYAERLLDVYAAAPDVDGCSGVIANYPPPSWRFRLWRRLFERGPFRDDRQPLYWRAHAHRDTALVTVRGFGGGLMSFRASSLRDYRVAERPGCPRDEDLDFCLGLGRVKLVVTPRARLRHRNGAGSREGNWRAAELAGARHLYERFWRQDWRNRLRFAWLRAGYALLAVAARAGRGLPWLVVALLAALMYAPVLAGLARQWWQDPNYGHGFLVPLVSGAIVWQTRDRWRRLPRRGSTAGGMPLLVAALALAWLGVLGAQVFLARVSLLLLLAGAVVFLAGWRLLRAWAFPFAFLAFMIPLPAVIYYQITFPLQILASKLAATGLDLVSVPVLREGNLIVLPNTTLSVAEACSGIRSLISLLALAIAYAHFCEPRRWKRIALALLMVPIAIASNGLRILGTGILTYAIGPQMAEGFFHAFSGWLIFVFAVGLMLLVHRALRGRRPALRPAPIVVAPRRSAWREEEEHVC